MKTNSKNTPPAVSTKEPIVSTTRPIVSTKGPIVSTKGPIVSTKKPAVFTKRQTVSTKKNKQLVSPMQHTKAANEVVRPTYDRLKYVVSLAYFSRKIIFR